MSKHVNCTECNKYLAEIRDAKMSKSIVFLCSPCLQNLRLRAEPRDTAYPDNPFMDMFNNAIKKGKSF